MVGGERALSGTLFGLIVAGVVLVVLLATRRIGRRSFVPFGPFLIIGALWAVLIRVWTAGSLQSRTGQDHRPIRDPGGAPIHSRSNAGPGRSIIPGSRIPASSCGSAQSRMATSRRV